MPHPKLMLMVSFCWKINFLPSKKKKKKKKKSNPFFVTMTLKLMIEVVAFFLGYPVYALTSLTIIISHYNMITG